MEPAMTKTLIATMLAVAAFAFTVPQLAHAADTGPSTPGAQDNLGPARAAIAAKQWRTAIDELKRVNDTASADWNNLMGYTHRKASPPDLEAAERYYNEALRLNPKHRGALEYSGELYLMKGDLPTAEKRLAALDKACFLPCDEYRDLKSAVARYKAAGNRYLPTSY